MSGNCKGCGGVLPALNRKGNPRVWCSGACRARYKWREAGGWSPDGEVRRCASCDSEFVPVRQRQTACSKRCRSALSARVSPKNPDWIEGRRSEREIPCMDCGELILSRANRQACAACKAKRNQTTNRRKSAKRKGAAVGVRYTLAELGERDGWRCHLCRRSVDRTLPGTAAMGPTVDHLVPLAAGGMDELRNVSLAHRSCNVQRRDKGIAQLRLTG